MMTIEEMAAHSAYLAAFLRKSRQDWIAEMTEELETEKNPYVRERLIENIEQQRKELAAEEHA